MIHGMKVVVVMPAYRAAKTLERTYQELPKEIIDSIVLVDDGSDDKTAAISKALGLHTFLHNIT
jgi:glycosyltransferase involved in cell wall biosynthesis